MANATVDPLAISVPKALELGWTMATLYNPPAHFGLSGVEHLPTEHELDGDKRRDLELGRLTCLLSDLVRSGVGSLSVASIAATTARESWLGVDAQGHANPEPGDQRNSALRSSLRSLNLAILEGLACASNDVELAYQVGRSLRDTVSIPPLAGGADRTDGQLVAALPAVLGQERIATLRQWLETLTPHLPKDSATVVGTSLGRWSEFAGAALDTSRPGGLKTQVSDVEFARSMVSYLLRQGDVWLGLLTGSQAMQGLLDPEGYVAAAELALKRTTKIVIRILRHYWAALAVLAIALGGILSLSAAYLGGPGRVWTSIAAIATSLGVSAKGIGSAMSRMAKEAEMPIFGLEKQDVMAWSITALPPVRLDTNGVRALRRAGIAPSRRLLSVR